MRKTRTLGIGAGAIIAVVVAAVPAAAVYYITGWYETGGLTSLDGCGTITRTFDVHYGATEDYFCQRDVGVRVKGAMPDGTTWENAQISWGSHYAKQTGSIIGWDTGMKVYHGNH